MLIADAQVHLWEKDPPGRPLRHGARPFRLDDLLVEMQVAGVHRAIIVPPFWEGTNNTTAVEAARLYPDRFRVMGRFEFGVEPDQRGMQNCLRQHGMLGFRLTYHTPELICELGSGNLDWFWGAAEAAGIPLMIYAPGALATLQAIAARHPRLRITIDHMGIDRDLTDDAAFAHIAELSEIAKLSNVSVKVTTLPIYSAEPYPHPKLHLYMRRLYGSFGAQRLFWGSDLTRLPCSYGVCIRLFTEEFNWLPSEDLELIMGRGLCDWLGWPL